MRIECAIVSKSGGEWMPTLFTFDAFKIRLYFSEHGIPHVHLIGADCDAAIAIDTGEVIVGDAPAAALDRARAWIADNRPMLLDLWRT
jgi:hypothetical protein